MINRIATSEYQKIENKCSDDSLKLDVYNERDFRGILPYIISDILTLLLLLSR